MLGLAGNPLWAQPGTPPPWAQSGTLSLTTAAKPIELTKFNLNFAGGTPRELAAAIESAMGRRLNVIVPEEFADVKLPGLKMEHVDVAQLFQALGAASQKDEAVSTGRYGGPMSYQVTQTGYGFRQGPQQPLSDDTIWYFFVTKPALPPLSASAKSCRFYSLAPYLERKLTVDDITTAIETGWKMLGESQPPTISFHKDTKLLIAVGEPSKLEIINAVLKALEAPKAAPAPFAVKPGAKPGETPTASQ
jgi:hypothetical protein